MIASSTLRRRVRWTAPGATVLALAFALLGNSCDTGSAPPADTVLRLTLNDSLTRFESVEITLWDAQDTTKFFETVYSGVLASPSQIPAYTLKAASGKDFVVKVKGFLGGGQLAMETLIYYRAGKKTVVHAVTPPLVPRNWLVSLAPSAGSMTPKFNKDSTAYKVVLPLGTNRVTLTAQGAFEGTTVKIGSSPATRQFATAAIVMDTSVEAVGIFVTDSTLGTAKTRAYTVDIIPSAPPRVQLDSIKVSIGDFYADFQPDFPDYSVDLKAMDSVVTFRLIPADPSSTFMLLEGAAILPGEVSKPVVVNGGPGSRTVITIDVYRGAIHGYYTITINRALL